MVKEHLEIFEKSIDNLDEVLRIKKNSVVRDSAIKRFELCFDLAWKCIKEYAKTEGQECNSPRQSFKVAYKLGLIKYESRYIDMIDDRNVTVHTYNQEVAERIYKRLKKYLKLFQTLYAELAKRISRENLFADK